ncbi:MAG: NADPH-dependent oxidoreductase [Phycisphaerales bacterium]
MPHTQDSARTVLDLLMAHRSIRRFAPDPVPDEDLRTAVAAGQMASTSSAVQAYCAIRVRDEQTRDRVADLCGPQEKVAQSGAFLVICGDTRRHRLAAVRDGNAYDQRLESFLVAAIDASLFAEKTVIALEAMGYGICYIGGLRNHIDEVDRLLELPEGVYPLFGLCVGIPAESPGARPRLPVEAVLFEERYPADEAVLDHLDSYDAAYIEYLRERGVADPVPWSVQRAGAYTEPKRPHLGPYYTKKGADLR